MNFLETNKKEQLGKVGNIAVKMLSRFEIGLVIAAILSFTLMTQQIEIGSMFLMIALNILIILYFFKAFAKLDDPIASGLEIFLIKLYCWSLSVALLGILFVLSGWPGWDTQLTVGTISLFISSIFLIYLKTKKPELKVFSKKSIVRAIIVLVVSAFLLLTPADKLLKIGIIKLPIQNDQVENR